MFRRLLHGGLITLSVTAISAVTTPAAAQSLQAPPCSAPLQLVGDLGFTGIQCTGCSMTARQIPGLATFEFSTEPTLVGITKGGPAEGKLQEFDVLVALNDQLITTRAAAVLYSWPPLDKSLRMTVRRAGALKDVEILPAPRCRAISSSALQLRSSALSMPAPSLSPNRGWLGVTLCCESAAPGLTTFSSYPEITNVVSDSPAERSGLKVGDMLVAMDGLSLKSVDGMSALRNVKPGQKVLLSLVRDGDWLKLTVILGSPR
jgi:S1-C subfamily serine protease